MASWLTRFPRRPTLALAAGALVVSLLTGTVQAGMGRLSTAEIEEELQVS